MANPGNSGSTSFTPVENNVKMPVSRLPESIQELRRAGNFYEPEDRVKAFVVMEEAPLSESGISRRKVSRGAEQRLLTAQNRVINQIQSTVPGGEDMKIRYQFTYLTNSFTVETEFQNLEQIAGMKGVKSVFLMPVYTPATAAAGQLTGVPQVWQDYGYTGAGMKIAIIDTGLDLDHPSFAAAPAMTADSMMPDDINSVLPQLNAADLYWGLSADELYVSEKVPFAFNYADANLQADHSADYAGDHGTHVAGIAAANPVWESSVVGVAPDAQIIVMKVFGKADTASTDDVVAALEDAMLLGCDVVNASLGSPAGFSSANTEIDEIFRRLDQQDIVACFSAGNEFNSGYGNLWGLDMSPTRNPDNGVVGQPGTYANIMTVASADSGIYLPEYIALSDGTLIPYTISAEEVEYRAGNPAYEAVSEFRALAGKDLSYVFVPGLGVREDFYDEQGVSLVAGKIAVVRRGELSFSEKVFHAEEAGALAVIVWDPNYDDVSLLRMVLSDDNGNYPGIPAVLISTYDADCLMNWEEDLLRIVDSPIVQSDGYTGQMSWFSSWGVTPDLRLEPDITGIGGNVYSCLDGGNYGFMSGTSMSSPQVAGISALVMQYVRERFPNAQPGARRDLVQALLMSNADPIINSDSGVEASPRQQGAGLVNAFDALRSEAYLTANGELPKVSTGDSASGTFSFQFEVHNFSDTEKTFSLSSSLLTEKPESYENQWYMSGQDQPLTGTVAFDRNQVTVPAGGSAVVHAEIILSDEDRAFFQQYWENGGFVEGFVYLSELQSDLKLNLPFLGFYGDWLKAPLFDAAFWYDDSFWSDEAKPESDLSWHTLWTIIDGADWVPGINPYIEDPVAEGALPYDPARNIISPNGDGRLDCLDDIYLSLLRNARSLTLSWQVNGQEIFQETTTENSKTMYDSDQGMVIPWCYWDYGILGLYAFTDEWGNPLPSGTRVTLDIGGKLDYSHGGTNHMSFELTVDTEAPELVAVREETAQGRHLLILEARDDTFLASAFLMNGEGNLCCGVVHDYDMEYTEQGTWLVTMDVTGMGQEFLLTLCDYGANEATFRVTCESDTGGEPSEMPSLYAFRAFDSLLSVDEMKSWISLTPGSYDSLSIQDLSDQNIEDNHFAAAEYAAGRVFAIDDSGELYVLNPDTFAGRQIASLGIQALDMTFDDSTDSMYVLSADGESTYLYRLDLLACNLESLCQYAGDQPAPVAITDSDEGILYALAAGYDTMCAIDPFNGALMPIAGATLPDVPVTREGSHTMAYADGTIYWHYYFHTGEMMDSGMVSLNTKNWTSREVACFGIYQDWLGDLISAEPEMGLSGLMTMAETEYTLPQNVSLAGLTIDPEEIALTVGKTCRLEAVASPWYCELSSVKWQSSDPSVVLVSDGTVTAMGEGTAVITVAAGTFRAECRVTVSSGDGSYLTWNRTDQCWAEINRKTPELVNNLTEYNAEADVAALASAEGLIYGYDTDGCLFLLNPVSFEREMICDRLPLDEDWGDGYEKLVRDMDYDPLRRQMLVLVETVFWDAFWGEYSPVSGGSSIYSVDLNTGDLTLRFTDYEVDSHKAITVDNQGNLYLFSSDTDCIYRQDTSGTRTILANLQDWGFISYWNAGAFLHYDSASDTLNLLFSETGESTRLLSCDAETGEMLQCGYVGDVYWDLFWYTGDVFSGLTTMGLPVHQCNYLNGVCQTCGAREGLDYGAMLNPFTDVGEDAYYHQPVLWAVHHGLTSGVSDTSFAPDAVCTRAQMMTFLWRTAGSPAPATEVNPFTDVRKSDYFYQAVLWAVEQGITAGTAQTTFAPNDQCTRAQSVTFLYRWKGQTPTADEQQFEDVTKDQYFSDAVAWAVEHGITAGMTPTTFVPNAHCTRGQIMTFLYRLWFA